jgi:hypothetical protein
MYKLILLSNLLFCSIIGLSQTDTVVVKNQKGFLFLSFENGRFDYNGGHWRPIGFEDYFFPGSSVGKEMFIDSNITVNFMNGVRVNFIASRNTLKKKAILLNCSDTSKCYPFKKFYIVPVTTSYKEFKDIWPLACKRDSFALRISNGSKVRFKYRHRAMAVIKYAVNN